MSRGICQEFFSDSTVNFMQEISISTLFWLVEKVKASRFPQIKDEAGSELLSGDA